MNADTFRQLYNYHFSLNRKLWEDCIMPLTQAQFIQDIDYSVGSIRNQVVHLLNVDERWFCGLRGVEVPGFINPQQYHEREAIREKWDVVEADMRGYLDALTDEEVARQFIPQAQVWQVLFHVLNHGTDHRAQMLAMLHPFGVPTFPQDYFHFINR